MTPSELEAKSIWTVNDLCEYTGMAKGYIYQLTSRREIPHSKPSGSKLFFERDKIIEWLKGGQVETAENLRQVALARSPYKL